MGVSTVVKEANTLFSADHCWFCQSARAIRCKVRHTRICCCQCCEDCRPGIGTVNTAPGSFPEGEGAGWSTVTGENGDDDDDDDDNNDNDSLQSMEIPMLQQYAQRAFSKKGEKVAGAQFDLIL